MRRTRFMSLLFLVWSAAFFFVPNFRQAFEGPAFMWSLEKTPGLAMRAGVIKQRTLEKFAREAEQRHDARTLAFVALHLPDEQESQRLAEEAVGRDPQLTWIFYSLVSRNRGSPVANRWIARMQAWDPENALPHVLEGEQISYRRRDSWPGPANWEDLEKETAWREVMAKAFAAPHYESYGTRRFDLERTWLRQNHLDKPPIVLLSVWSYPIPNLLNIRMYAKLLISKFGKTAEERGRLADALGYYWTVAHFGEKMQLESVTIIEHLVGAALQDEAYERLVPLLRRSNRSEEAATVEYAHRQFHQRLDQMRGKDPLAQSSNYYWAASLVHLFAAFVLVFGALAAASIVYVNFKRWRGGEKKGRIYQTVTALENYVPVLLFLACLGLYFSYFPYAENFRHYMRASGDVRDFEPLFYNVFPNFLGPPGHLALPIENPFFPYVWYALGGFALVVIVSLVFRRRIPEAAVSDSQP